jgi:hypothetical protein
LQDALLQGHKVFRVHDVPRHVLGMDNVAAHDAAAVFQDLPQQWFAHFAQVDQINLNPATGTSHEVKHRLSIISSSVTVFSTLA